MKKLAAILLTGCMLFCTGCNSAVVQVRDRTYIQGALFSIGEQTELTLYPFEETELPLIGIGATVAAAIEETTVQSGRSVFMGHLELLCFDNPIFTGNLRDCMEQYRLSPACKLLYLHETTLPEKCNTLLLTDQLRQEEENGRIPMTDLFHILSEREGGDGAALIPAWSEDGFTMCVINGETVLGTLSDRAVQGLCWLRGENFPKRITITGNDGAQDFEIDSARTELSAEIRSGMPHITVTIHLQGSGNTEAAKRIITAVCQAAELETLKQMKADVMGLDACLAQDCPDYYTQQDFETAKWAAVFEHVIIAK